MVIIYQANNIKIFNNSSDQTKDIDTVDPVPQARTLVGVWHYTYKESGCDSLEATGTITFRGDGNILTYASYKGKDIYHCSLVDTEYQNSINLANDISVLKQIDGDISECFWISDTEISCSYPFYNGTIILKK